MLDKIDEKVSPVPGEMNTPVGKPKSNLDNKINPQPDTEVMIVGANENFEIGRVEYFFIYSLGEHF